MTGTETAKSTAKECSIAGTAATDWHQWCRLCAKPDTEGTNVFLRNGVPTWPSAISLAIGKYFWVNIKPKDELSEILCKDCYSLVDYLIDFSERVNRVQTLFTRLNQLSLGSALDYDELRKECGLQGDDWKHLAARETPAENEEPIQKTELDEIIESYNEDEQIMELIENEDNSFESYESTDEGYTQHEDATHLDTMENEEYFEDETAGVLSKSIEDEVITAAAAQEEDDDEEEEDLKDSETESIDVSENQEIPSKHAQFQCNTCSKNYVKPMAYRRHMADVHGVVATDMPNLECKRCNQSFATEIQLTAHYRTHLPAKEKADNACSHCSKIFTTPGALKRHILCIHENLKPYICDCCGKALKTITALNEHKLVHTDECPFECQICHRQFKNMARLKIHSDTHAQKNYECNICGLKLNTRRTLNMHQLVHSDAKQFKCDVCGAAFKRGKTLKAHLILHTGIRPYKCNFCGKDFSNGSNCRMHKRKKHPKELAEEEARGVIRSTLLPMINELTEASKRVKKPAKTGNAISIELRKPVSGDTDTEPAADEVLYELVDE